MNKAEIISHMAEHSGLTKAEAGKALEAFEDAVTSALTAGDSATLQGFGVFSVTKRAERTGRNPATGASLTIPARTVPKFKPAKTLNDKVQGK